jgi:type II pantothenate kinase
MQFPKTDSQHSINTKESFIDSSVKRNIVFPKQEIDITHIAVDIGGSLAKVVWFTKLSQGGRLNFKKFETSKINQLIDFLKDLLSERDSKVGLTIKATGGGAHKYYDLFQNELNVSLQKEDEMEW